MTKERDMSPKNKWVALDDNDFTAEEFPLSGWGPNFTPGDLSGTIDIPLPDCNFDDFFASLSLNLDPPPTLDKLSSEKEIARLQGEAAARSIRDPELAKKHARALRRTERKGRQKLAAMVNNCAAHFATEFGRLNEA
ncbi:hypothetical protein IGI04_035615 [Brassica rapa subsp. trilocularis]|uniref:BZIP domain-containing protein n=1 Tax=Brassica rapa subsp. trilocularis TaxID=1813537 RepID=A0ABQ7LEW5_BRACM|nr:hypothetical protein IGI04_035615 [Brassica rapa subsp. trilocularis]